MEAPNSLSRAELPPPATPADRPTPDAPSRQERQERIAALYAAGHSYRAIARMLDLPLATVWRTVQRLAREQPAAAQDDPRALELARAIAVQRQITNHAWQICEAEEHLEAAALAGHLTYTRRRVIHHVDPTGAPAVVGADAGAPTTTPPTVIVEETHRPTFCSRRRQLLRIILAAEREIARLEGLHTFAARQNTLGDLPRLPENW